MPFDIPIWVKAIVVCAALGLVALATWWVASNLASILKTLGIILIVAGALAGGGGVVRKNAILGIPGGTLIAMGIAAVIASDELSE